MDLKTFVSESLNQIIQGIEAAQSSNKASQVNPSDVSNYAQKVVEIAFDVAVTVEKGSGTQGGISVLTGILGLGASGESKQSDLTTHRLRFAVPVRFPFKQGFPVILQ